MSAAILDWAGVRFDMNPARAVSLAITLDFDGPQPGFFGAPSARRKAMQSGGFTGDTRQGGSCNCEVLEITPHCNGTHTECVGHITEARATVSQQIGTVLCPALLLSIQPARLDSTEDSGPGKADGSDPVISKKALEAAWQLQAPATPPQALILRTLPNSPDKARRDWMEGPTPPWITREAAQWIVDQGIDHLLVDMPSVDRGDDDGELVTHRIFWGLPAGSRKLIEAERPQASVTEMIFAADAVLDGFYLLNLQYPDFSTDATPSKPLLHPLAD
ncbi:cyclase family protein [Natronospira bacteriovora]|uniref:Cyclase family protein n=1 Tax=Natronospira bacteriovora TaxID=3069753 RepID=A0ABU0W486_9GAMM|nr:cyclase family protein [Natronospira sp. AB-CW4]MDQ2068781.1 cyclase family protein [Natronospira sp. AB-CW4]